MTAQCMTEDVFNVSKRIVWMSCLTITSTFCSLLVSSSIQLLLRVALAILLFVIALMPSASLNRLHFGSWDSFICCFGH